MNAIGTNPVRLGNRTYRPEIYSVLLLKLTPMDQRYECYLAFPVVRKPHLPALGPNYLFIFLTSSGVPDCSDIVFYRHSTPLEYGIFDIENSKK